MKTYGWIDSFKGSWIVEAQPHVVVALKRVFGSVGKRKHDRICITDTLESSRNLEWFLSRYPLAYKNAAVETRLAERASKHRDGESVVDALISGERKPAQFRLALPPREYQRVDAEMVLTTGGVLIASDLGTGKTIGAICMISDPRARPAVVVVMTHLPTQWQSELRKFAPKLSVHICAGTRPYDVAKQMPDRKPPDVYIVTYSRLAGWSPVLAEVCSSVTFDEVQELRRGSESDKGAAALHLASKVKYRFSASATPIYNFGGEIYNIMQATRPGALGSKDEFTNEWCVGDGRKLKLKDPRAFGAYMLDSGLMIRNTRQSVGREIPALTRVLHHIECDAEELNSIEGAATALAKTILTKEPTAKGEKFRAAEELSMLVRLATGIAKAGYIAEFCRMLIEQDEKVVLFAWHRRVYEVLMDKLKDFAPALYTGSETTNQKIEAKRRFVEGETPILIMSLRSGAGLDGLQHVCRNVVIGELDWSPGVMEQDIGRVHRDGQLHPVMAYFLLTDSGSDPVVADVLGLKRAQVEGLRDPNGALEQNLEGAGDHVKRLAQAYLDKRTKSLSSGARVVK